MRLGLVAFSRVEAQVARLYRSFCSSLCDFLVGGPSSREKHLDKFFKIFVSKVFGNLSWRLVRDLVQLQKMHVLRILDSFKNFSIFPRTFLTVHCLVPSYHSQTHRVSHEKPPFFFIISTSILKKRYGFSYFL